MNEAQPAPTRRGRRTRIAAASALVIAVAAALYLVLINNSNGAGKTNGNAANTYTGSTTVQRRNLISEDTESGTLGHARSYTVYNRVSGTITWLPSPGDVIKPGQTMFRVDNKPVLLMDGTTPAYRDLSSKDGAGPDILELNANLIALGYNPDGIVIDDKWQAATTAGVKELQKALGEGQSGKILLGKVIFLPGNQLVSTVQGTVGATVSLTTPTSHTEFVSLDTTTNDANPATGTTDTTGTTGTATTTPPTTTAGTTTTPTTPTDTTPTTTAPSTTTGTTTTPTNTSTTGTPSTTPGNTTPTHTTPGGSDNLSQKTLQALLKLVREQQQALAHEQNNNHSNSPSNNHSNSPSNNHSNSPSNNHSNSPSNNHSNSPSNNHSNSPSNNHSNNNNNSSNNNNNSNHSNSPSNHSHSPSNPSGGGGAGTAIMSTTSTRLVVTVDLSPSSQSEAVVGGHVTVELPDGSKVPGTITAVSSVAQSSNNGGGNTGNTGGGNGGSSSVPVTITLDKSVSGKGLDQAAVSVEFVQARANNVLSVPVTALLATSGSSYAVQEAAPPHRLIPVHTGMFAAGDVQISGPGIHPGLRVTDSQG